MKDTVVIMGSHPGTRGDFDWEREDCDVWVFNEAMKSPWCKRADAVFQLHQPVIWRSTTNRNDPEHYKWLQTTEIPVYMIDRYEDVPASIKYPLDEVLKLTPVAYLTSSVAYAIALAIYQGYKRIEVYGVEMETKTEYGHQRVGVGFWLGIAIGKGIEVDFHSNTMFTEPMYGFEGSARIELDQFQQRADVFMQDALKFKELYELGKEQFYKDLEEMEGDMKLQMPDIEKRIAALGRMAHAFGESDGIRQLNNFYERKCEKQKSETGDYLIVKQEFESYAVNAAKDYQAGMLKAMDISRLMKERVDKLQKAESKFERREANKALKEILSAYIKVTTQVGAASGIGQENTRLMKELDMNITAMGGEKALEIVMQERANRIYGELIDAWAA